MNSVQAPESEEPHRPFNELSVLFPLLSFYKASKYIWEGRRGDDRGEPPELTDRHERIMALARERGRLTNRNEP
ncbi:MAG: hypothetical protein HY343_13075 [Lentisphaerae bacterium]|nr:hypothetical protein [Lentisphaerota bacterium]